MANVEFGTSATQSPEVQSHVTAKEGIGKSPVLLEGLGNLTARVDELFSDKKEKKENVVVANLIREQLKISEAVNQNIYGADRGNILHRVNLMKAIDANPQLARELLTVQREIRGTGGGGAIIDKRTIEEQRTLQKKESLINAGLLGVDHTENEFKAAELNARLAVAADTQHRETMQTINLALAVENLSDAQIKKHQAEKTAANVKYMQDSVPAARDKMKNTFERIVNGNGKGSDKVFAINESFNAWYAQEAAKIGDLSATEYTAYVKPMEMARDLYISWANGELEKEALDNKLSNLVTNMEVTMASDPKVANVAAGVKLFGDNFLTTAYVNDPQVLKQAMKIWQTVGDDSDDAPLPNIYGEKRVDYEAWQRSVEVALKGLDGDEQSKSEAEAMSTTMFESLAQNIRSIKLDPAKGKNPYKVIASQEFYKLVSQNPELFEPYREEITDGLQRNFYDEVSGMVRREFTDAKVVSQESVTASEFGEEESLDVSGEISYTFSSGVIKFTAMSDDVTVRNKARDLNEKLAPVIQRSIKGIAHLDGHNNYDQVWKEHEANYMGTLEGAGGEEEAPGGDAGDDLTIDDFRQGAVDADPLEAGEITQSFATGSGFTHGRVMKSVDGMVIHHTGGHGDAAHVANVLNNRNASVQFVIDREGKVHQLMPDNHEAWHAGKNNTSGFDNKNTIGVEIVGMDDNDILPAQLQAARSLIRSMSDKYGFEADKVFGHGEIATHKQATEGSSVIKTIRGNG